MTAQKTWLKSDQLLIEQWLESLGDMKPQTRKNYLDSFRRFQDAHDRSILKMTPKSVNAAFDLIRSWGMSGSTVRATKTPLRKFVRYLADQGKLSESTVETLLTQALYQESQVRKKTGTILDFRLAEVLIKAPVPEPRLVMFLTVVVGLTINEIVPLTWKNISIDEQFIWAASKTGAERAIGFDTQGWEFFMELLFYLPSYQNRQIEDQPLMTDINGNALDYPEIHRLIQMELDKHNINATPAQICPSASVMGERYILTGLDFDAIRRAPLPPPNDPKLTRPKRYRSSSK